MSSSSVSVERTTVSQLSKILSLSLLLGATVLARPSIAAGGGGGGHGGGGNAGGGGAHGGGLGGGFGGGGAPGAGFGGGTGGRAGGLGTSRSGADDYEAGRVGEGGAIGGGGQRSSGFGGGLSGVGRGQFGGVLPGAGRSQFNGDFGASRPERGGFSERYGDRRSHGFEGYESSRRCSQSLSERYGHGCDRPKDPYAN